MLPYLKLLKITVYTLNFGIGDIFCDSPTPLDEEPHGILYDVLLFAVVYTFTLGICVYFFPK